METKQTFEFFLLAHLMMWMVHTRRVLVAKILILHRIEPINWVQYLRCRNQRRQLLKRLVVHPHQAIVRHCFAFDAGCSVCEWKNAKFYQKYFCRRASRKNRLESRQNFSKHKLFPSNGGRRKNVCKEFLVCKKPNSYLIDWPRGHRSAQTSVIIIFCLNLHFHLPRIDKIINK